MATLKDKHLHIVSFDVPWPADYGGVIDVFYKIKALYAQGVKVYLHCYHYGRKEAPELEEICEEVYYYPRNMNRTLLMHPMPFIVVSRQQDTLLYRLMQDDYPILFEGKHTTYYIDHPDLQSRRKYVRAHNVEEDYYKGLSSSERNPVKKWYLKRESNKLQNHRQRLSHAAHIFAISPADQLRFEAYTASSFVGPFHSNEGLNFESIKKPFCLYHGNLSVAENIDAALFLIREVFCELEIELKIFGRGAPRRLHKEVAKYKHISIQSGSQDKLEVLVRQAQVNVLPTFQSTGMKLKLLYSLFNGGHVLVSPQMVEGTGIEPLVTIANDTAGFVSELKKLMGKEFSSEQLRAREQQLSGSFSNAKQAQQLISEIFD